MKKLIYLLLIIPAFAQAQYTSTLPSGYTPFATQMYYKITGSDTTFIEGATGKGFHRITANQALKDSLLNYQIKLISGTNIKTVNGTSILGSGDFAIPLADSSIYRTVANSRTLAQTKSALDLKAKLAGGNTFTGTQIVSGSLNAATLFRGVDTQAQLASLYPGLFDSSTDFAVVHDFARGTGVLPGGDNAVTIDDQSLHLQAFSSTVGGDEPRWQMSRSRGTIGTPVNVAAGDYLGRYVWNTRWSGLNTRESVIETIVTDASGTYPTAKINFGVKKTGDARLVTTSLLEITPDGYVTALDKFKVINNSEVGGTSTASQFNDAATGTSIIQNSLAASTTKAPSATAVNTGLSGIQAQINTNTSNIATNTSNIASNTAAIATKANLGGSGSQDFSTKTLTVAKSSEVSTINFPQTLSDPGSITHEELGVSDIGVMRFSAGDNDQSNDYFAFGNSSGVAGARERFRITATGVVNAGIWQASPVADNYIASANGWNAKVNTVVLNTPSVIYATPVTFTTTAGTATGTLSLNTQTANTILAGPSSGAAATPSFRALVAADIPALPYATDALAAHLAGAETFTGAKTFTGGITHGNASATNTVATYTNSNSSYTLGVELNGVNRFILRPTSSTVPVLSIQQSGDVTNGAFFEFFGRGNPATTNSEALRIILNNAYTASGTNNAVIETYKAGVGTLRALELRTNGNSGQLVLNPSGTISAASSITSTSFIKSGGTSSQFLMADGSSNGTAYAALTGATFTGGLTVNGANLNIANAFFVTGRNAANTGAVPLIGVNASDQVVIGAGGFSVVLSGALTAPVLSLPNTGSAKTAGNATLVGGTVTVSTTAALSTSVITLTRKTSGGTIGTSITYTVSSGTSFTITSDNILDTSTFSYTITQTY